MSNSLNTQKVLWLDPFRALSGPERAQLAGHGLLVHAVSTLDDLQAALDGADLLVVRLEGNTDLLLELQTLVSARSLTVPVVCRVERRDMALAVAAMRSGALHVLAGDDFSFDAWSAVSVRPAPESVPAPATVTAPAPRTVVYVDPTSRHLLALAQRVAQANVTALIEGPTGAGKEVLARVLHESSARARGPFIALNCAALPEHLIEDMLFGHEKGAFTGAVKDHRGLFEQAQGGTLFLDEIGEMPVQLQAKLLRVLQERQLVRLGGERLIDLDVRVVAATNKDLRQSIVRREFREDLYFRLSTFKLRVPPLRERPGDILPLVARLLVRHAQAGRVLSINAAAQASLQAYAWPGNVRELENVVLRAVVLCTDEVITPAHLMFDDQPQVGEFSAQPALQAGVGSLSPWSQAMSSAAVSYAAAPISAQPAAAWVAETAQSMLVPEAASLQAAVQINEHQLIMAAISSTYSRMEAARKLGISPRTLRYKLAKLKSPVKSHAADCAQGAVAMGSAGMCVSI
jgi:two-component system response regulator FlrC